MSATRSVVFVAVFTLPFVRALQQNSLGAHGEQLGKLRLEDADLEYVLLNETETEERGSVCLDGSIAGFYYKPGIWADKWIIAIEAGHPCESVEECARSLQQSLSGTAPDSVDLTIFKTTEFKHYHHVMLHRCDHGLFSGDQEAPSTHQGKKLYFRGKRILDHVVDTLKKDYHFEKATEVLLVGGSGGAQTVFIVADYVAGLMPPSVKKFGGVPFNGWYPAHGPGGALGAGGYQKELYHLHNMSDTVAPLCLQAYPKDQQHLCLAADIAYKYSQTPMFVVQMLDKISINAFDTDEAHMDWDACMSEATTARSLCTHESIHRLTGFSDSVWTQLRTGRSQSSTKNGGFVSTCGEHVFYRTDDYFTYGKDGTTVDQAVLLWWKNLGIAEGKWYEPCTLNKEYPYQCESSCHTGSF